MSKVPTETGKKQTSQSSPKEPAPTVAQPATGQTSTSPVYFRGERSPGWTVSAYSLPTENFLAEQDPPFNDYLWAMFVDLPVGKQSVYLVQKKEGQTSERTAVIDLTIVAEETESGASVES
ncbi:hypothetical protein [Pseudomonas fluorescens]|jgi:hypothetical protein|uniref:hypothetical protein n=1 Tax=Pseudomonas fluorescens TaxID=294 RepID=UPI00054C636A|nr:hypothetical protein [Pseudomonas fluorescens]KII38277.1 hypothetical protein RY26_02025 [Pseudomonas fluorescens]